MTDRPAPATMAIQFWVVSALYVSESNWLSWLYRHDSPYASVRRHANACRARAMVIHDRVLNGETS